MRVLQKRKGSGIVKSLPVLDGLYVQFDAADTSNYTMNSNKVVRFNSTNNPDVYLSNEDGGGGTITSYNGVPAIRTDFTNKLYFTDTSGTSHNQYTVFCVNVMHSGSYPIFFAGGDNIPGGYAGIEMHQGTISGNQGDNGFDWFGGFGYDNRATLTGMSAYDTLHHYTITGQNSIHSSSVYRNGVAAAMTPIQTDVSLTFRLGPPTYRSTAQQGGIAHHNTDVTIGEILFYNRVLSQLERESVEAYLMEKWGT